MKEYPCEMSKTKLCRFGGTKHYNYGFVRGTASYCRLAKKWVSDMKECPDKPLSHEVLPLG